MEFPLGDGGGGGGGISKIAHHLVMKNKNRNLLQLEMGKYFQAIIRIIIYILV